jgi:hypothetical protein
MSSARQKTVLMIEGRSGEATPEEDALSAAGYRIFRSRPGAKAVQAALDKGSPDLVILDYLYGDKVSEYLFHHIAGMEGIQGRPIILLSSRPGSVLAIERDLPSAAAVLERRCPVEELVSAVDRVLAPEPADVSPIAPAGSAEEEALSMVRGCETAFADGADPFLAEAARSIAGWLGERIRPVACEPAAAGGVLSLARRVLDAGAIKDLARRIQEILGERRRPGIVAIAGLLGLPDLIECLSHGRVTGIVTVRGGGNRVEIGIRDGSIRFLNPREIQLESWGDTISVDRFTFPASAIRAALAESDSTDDSLFLRLIDTARIQSYEIRGFMISLGIEVLRECVLDPNAVWLKFEPVDKLPERLLGIGMEIPSQKLILRLSSHLDEWRALQAEVRDPLVRYGCEPGKSAPDVLPSSDDQVVLLAVEEAPRTISELAPICQLSPFQVWRSLKHLQDAGLIRKIERPSSPPAEVGPGLPDVPVAEGPVSGAVSGQRG